MRGLTGFYRHLRTLRRETGGAALVEFALSFPIMVFVTLMIFDVGRGLFVFTTVNNVAAEGVRYASVRGPDSDFPATAADVEDRVRDQAAGLDPTLLDVAVSYEDANLSGNTVVVTVTYSLGFFLSPFIDQGTIPISAASRMTIL